MPTSLSVCEVKTATLVVLFVSGSVSTDFLRDGPIFKSLGLPGPSFPRALPQIFWQLTSFFLLNVGARCVFLFLFLILT